MSPGSKHDAVLVVPVVGLAIAPFVELQGGAVGRVDEPVVKGEEVQRGLVVEIEELLVSQLTSPPRPRR